MANDPEKRIQELHLTLPPAPKPVAVYKPAIKVGNLLFVSGHGPLKPDKTLILGKVGKTLTLEEGTAAARQTGLAILATLRETLGSLNKVKRLIKSGDAWFARSDNADGNPDFQINDGTPTTIIGRAVWMGAKL